MQTQADMGIGPVSCENCSVFKKGEGGPEAPGALRLRNKKATASVASSYSQNPPVGSTGTIQAVVGRLRLGVAVTAHPGQYGVGARSSRAGVADRR